MGTQKQTNKFDVYIQFLDNLVKRNTIELHEVSNRIELYKAVSAILDKRSRDELVSNYHYLELAKISCPDKTFFNLFGNSEEAWSNIDPDGPLMFEDDNMVSNCPETNCGACWKNYINALVDIIYKSDSVLKKIDFPVEEVKQS